MMTETENGSLCEPKSLPPLLLGWTRNKAILAFCIVAFGLWLRGWKFNSIPERGATIDEYAWTWSGLSLITNGEPHAWSYLDGYKSVEHVVWKGRDFPMVKPWMDHPPLFGLWMGAWVRAHGTTDIYKVNFTIMRQMSIGLAALTLIFLTLLIAQSHGVPTAIIALCFYATWPPSVQHNRLVISENFFMLFTFVGMFSLERIIAGSKRRGWVVALAVSSMCLPLIKLVASIFCLVLMVRALEARRWRIAIMIGATTAAGFAIYFAYGFTYGGETFWRVMTAQKDRFIGFMAWWSLMFGHETVHRSIQWLPLSAGVLLAFWLPTRSRSFSWAAAVPLYIMAMTFFAKDNEIYGWYYMPLYPFACAAVADRVYAAWQSHDLRTTWVLFLISWISLYTIVWARWDHARDHQALLRFSYIGVAAASALIAFACRPKASFAKVGLSAAGSSMLAAALIEIFAW